MSMDWMYFCIGLDIQTSKIRLRALAGLIWTAFEALIITGYPIDPNLNLGGETSGIGERQSLYNLKPLIA